MLDHPSAGTAKLLRLPGVVTLTSYQLSVISYQLSVISYQPSAISIGLSVRTASKGTWNPNANRPAES
ncbi:MAG TPA: hypothetical protein VGQ81_16875 [Acidobacteriota bacterium]|nr:hypothetical protein [Acidobacteriota bacterium]